MSLMSIAEGECHITETIFENRLMHAQQEIEMAPMYDYQIVNDEVERAADQLMAVIRAEQLKRNIKKEKADC